MKNLLFSIIFIAVLVGGELREDADLGDRGHGATECDNRESVASHAHLDADHGGDAEGDGPLPGRIQESDGRQGRLILFLSSSAPKPSSLQARGASGVAKR